MCFKCDSQTVHHPTAVSVHFFCDCRNPQGYIGQRTFWHFDYGHSISKTYCIPGFPSMVNIPSALPVLLAQSIIYHARMTSLYLSWWGHTQHPNRFRHRQAVILVSVTPAPIMMLDACNLAKPERLIVGQPLPIKMHHRISSSYMKPIYFVGNPLI